MTSHMNDDDLRVAITGAGMIGSHIAKELVDQGGEAALIDAYVNRPYVEDVVGRSPESSEPVGLVEGDVADFATVVDFLARYRPRAVVHTVGLIGGLAQSAPWKAIRANIMATANVAEASRITGVERIVYISTQGVYDVERCKTKPMTESSPVSAATVYPAGKLSAEHILEAYSRAAGLDAIALRVANVYGRGHYVTGSIGGQSFNALIEPVVRGDPGVILPGSRGRGEWVYVKDVARAVRLSLGRPLRPGFTVVNIGTGRLTTHEDVMAAVAEVCPGATFEEGEAHSMGALRQRYQPYDLRFAEETLGYTPKWDLRGGVADYVAEVRDFLARGRPASR